MSVPGSTFEPEDSSEWGEQSPTDPSIPAQGHQPGAIPPWEQETFGADPNVRQPDATGAIQGQPAGPEPELTPWDEAYQSARASNRDAAPEITPEQLAMYDLDAISQRTRASGPDRTWMNITALILPFAGVPLGGIILGHLGVRAANRGTASFKTLGQVGLIFGYLFSAIIVVALIVMTETILYCANNPGDTIRCG